MKSKLVFLLGFGALLVADFAVGKTWYVEKGGTGDYTVIQDAIDAAASGDTIRIGPGRFEDFTLHTFPGGDCLIVAYVEIDRITIIGEPDGSTILGPEAYGGICPVPYTAAVMYWSASPQGYIGISDLQFENVCAGVYGINTDSFIEVQDCGFTGGTYGVHTYEDVSVTNCTFDRQLDYGAVSYASADTVTFRDCTFYVADGVGVHFQDADLGEIISCEYQGDGGNSIGVVFEGGGGKISSSAFEDVETGLYLSDANGVTVEGTTIQAALSCIVSTSEWFFVRDCVLEGGRGLVLDLRARGLPHQFSGNHIIRGEGLAVGLRGDYYAPPGYHIDMTENWWGTTDPDSIAAWIHDANDEHNPPLETIIDYEPFLPGPVPEEKTSLGGLKALFR